jgi:hypothetical protein
MIENKHGGKRAADLYKSDMKVSVPRQDRVSKICWN